MSHMCVDATVRAANDLGYKTITIHDACATRELEFNGVITPAGQVHAALMSALAFAYGDVISTEALLAGCTGERAGQALDLGPIVARAEPITPGSLED